MVLTFALPQPQTGLAVLERPSFSMPRPAPPRATRGSVRDVWGQHVKDVLGLNTKGARVFNVKIQGATTFSNLDIFAEAGANAALVKGADVLVSNGQVSIEFDNIVQTAKVNAIEILP
jgi:Malectin domain